MSVRSVRPRLWLAASVIAALVAFSHAGAWAAGTNGQGTAGTAPQLPGGASTTWQQADTVSFQLYSESWSLMAAGRLDEARQLLEAARTAVPGDFDWLIADGLAWVRYYAGDLSAAEKGFEAVLDEHAGAYLSRKGLGFVAVERGQFGVALEHLRQSFQQNPYQLLVSYTVPALAMIEAGDPAKADEVLRLGEWVYPLSSDIKFLRARALAAMGQTEPAAQKAVDAAGLAPAYIDPVFDDLGLPASLVQDGYHALAWGLYFVGDSEGALARFEQYLDAGGTDPNAYRGRAFANYRLGNLREAIPDLERSAALEPDRLPPIAEAIPFEGSDKLWEITYDARSTLAWTYWQLADFVEAKALFEQVLVDHPDWIDAWTGLGWTLMSMGREDDAAVKFREALKLSPGYPYAAQGLLKAAEG